MNIQRPTRKGLDQAPARLLEEFHHLLLEDLRGPILDLACGDGRNGIYLARMGLRVVCCDRSSEGLAAAGAIASKDGLPVETWQVDLEKQGPNPLPADAYGGILVFRYLHRPLIPYIKQALKQKAFLIYETFTLNQPEFGRPRNPDFLLETGELLSFFKDWKLIHYFEGVKQAPQRAVAQLICRKDRPLSQDEGKQKTDDGGQKVTKTFLCYELAALSYELA